MFEQLIAGHGDDLHVGVGDHRGFGGNDLLRGEKLPCRAFKHTGPVSTRQALQRIPLVSRSQRKRLGGSDLDDLSQLSIRDTHPVGRGGDSAPGLSFQMGALEHGPALLHVAQNLIGQGEHVGRTQNSRRLVRPLSGAENLGEKVFVSHLLPVLLTPGSDLLHQGLCGVFLRAGHERGLLCQSAALLVRGLVAVVFNPGAGDFFQHGLDLCTPAGGGVDQLIGDACDLSNGLFDAFGAKARGKAQLGFQAVHDLLVVVGAHRNDPGHHGLPIHGQPLLLSGTVDLV